MSLEPGQEKTMTAPGTQYGLAMDTWKVSAFFVNITGGQELDVVMKHGDHIVTRGAKSPIARAANASIFQDMQRSYRREGAAELTRVGVGESRISVSDGGRFEFVVTCTGGCFVAPLLFKFRRV